MIDFNKKIAAAKKEIEQLQVLQKVSNWDKKEWCEEYGAGLTYRGAVNPMRLMELKDSGTELINECMTILSKYEQLAVYTTTAYEAQRSAREGIDFVTEKVTFNDNGTMDTTGESNTDYQSCNNQRGCGSEYGDIDGLNVALLVSPKGKIVARCYYTEEHGIIVDKAYITRTMQAQHFKMFENINADNMQSTIYHPAIMVYSVLSDKTEFEKDHATVEIQVNNTYINMSDEHSNKTIHEAKAWFECLLDEHKCEACGGTIDEDDLVVGRNGYEYCDYECLFSDNGIERLSDLYDYEHAEALGLLD
jgi:hypothetical protein